MKLYRKRDLKKSGIYAIKNLINNKVYVGKSINIYERMRSHINRLNKQDLDENRYLINSWHKYGRDAFQYIVLEYVDKDEELLKERELYWMQELKSTERDVGYNLRVDTSTNCIVSKETRDLQSRNRKQRYVDRPELKVIISENSKTFWANNPEIKKVMSAKLSDINTVYRIYQYDKQMNLIRIWNKVKDIVDENPNYKKHNIYAVCSGEKPSMYGFIWKKEKLDLQIEEESVII